MSCSVMVFPHTRRSSTTTSVYSKICSLMTRWKTSDASTIPNGNRRKRYLPQGVLKVQLASSNGICQKPDTASSFVKIFAPEIFVNMSSIVFIGKCCLLMALLKCEGTIHTRISPFGLCTVIIELAQSVGSVTTALPSAVVPWIPLVLRQQPYVKED